MTGVPTPRTVAILTPWYPNPESPYAGAFVQSKVAATAPGCDAMTVYHLEGWGSRVSKAVDRRTFEAHQFLVRHGLRRTATVADASLCRVPVPARSGMTYAVLADRFSRALRVANGGKPLSESVVHAHVGLRGGWSALENAAPGARVFVTEHASYLPRLLGQPDSRAMYDQVIERATGFFAVGEPVRRPLLQAFPHHADKIQMMPNPVPFSSPRSEPVSALKRWLFVGNLGHHKGVDLLIEAFAKCYADDDSLTLTIVGDGKIRRDLEERTVELGIDHVVEFRGSVAPEAAIAAMIDHDLLVHPSRFETFGMTIVEAVAVGTPVLVTRCGGPQTSLAGIESDAAEFIDVDDNPDTIVNGYLRMRERFPDDLNLAHARSVLAERYGYTAVGRKHHHVWFDDPVEGL